MDHICDVSGLLDIEDALAFIAKTMGSLTDIETLDAASALNCVLAEDIRSSISVPGYDNSAMDGYAFIFDDFNESKPLTLIGKSFAGTPFDGEVRPGECVRIMTGAVVPKGADTVIMQEAVEVVGSQIHINEECKQGANIRNAGSDILQNSIVLSKGRRLTAIDIGLIASIGVKQVQTFRRLTVAIFSTGDELTPIGEPLKTGAIYDSNRPMLSAMLTNLYCKVLDLGMIGDDPTSIKAAFEQASLQADCVITSGGVSVGEADYTKMVLDEIGEVGFWKLAIKPGKPLAFGRLNNSFFFGLPGNPVSAAVTFEKIVAPSLQGLSGEQAALSIRITAQASAPFKKRPGRIDYQRAYCWKENNQLLVKPVGHQSSGVLSGFVKSNCYAVLEKNRASVREGEPVNIELFTQ